MNSNVTRPLKTILADIDSNNEIATRDLETIPASVRPGHMGSINRAKANAPVLLQEYQEAVLANSLAFFVEGGEPGAAEQFADIARGEGTFSADAGAMYAGLADQIGAVMGGSKEFGINQVVQLDYLLRGIATTSGYGRAVDLPRTGGTQTLKTKEALSQHLRTLAETTADGANLNVLVMTKQLINWAVAKQFSGKTFAVVIINASAADKKLLKSRFTRSVDVSLDGVATIDAGFVIDTFKKTRKPAAPKAEAIPTETKPTEAV